MVGLMLSQCIFLVGAMYCKFLPLLLWSRNIMEKHLAAWIIRQDHRLNMSAVFLEIGPICVYIYDCCCNGGKMDLN